MLKKLKIEVKLKEWPTLKKRVFLQVALAINPFTQKPIPVWVSDYVLAGYGTGAIYGCTCT